MAGLISFKPNPYILARTFAWRVVVIGDGMGSVGHYIFRTTLGAFLVVLLGLAAVIWVEFSIDGGLRVAQALHDFDPMTSRGQTILAFIAIAALIVRLLVPVIARYAAAQQTHTWARYKPLFMFACLAALCVAMVFHSLTEWFHTDEEVYVTPAYLAQHMRLYSDFLYLQTPIYPLVLSQLLMLFSSVSPFLIARLLSAALAIGSVIVFFDLAARLSKSERVAAILASLFASAPLMLLAYGSSRNDIMPIFFGLCGVWFTLRGLNAERKQSGSYLALFLAGFCMALAVGAKLTAAFIPLSALLYIFLRAKRGLLPLVLGGAVGSLPIVYYATAAFDKFLFGNATFHLTIYKEFYTDIGMAEFTHMALSREDYDVHLGCRARTRRGGPLHCRRGVYCVAARSTVRHNRKTFACRQDIHHSSHGCRNPIRALTQFTRQTIFAGCSTVCVAQLRGAISSGAKNCGASADALFRQHNCRSAGIAGRPICGRSCAKPEPFAVDRD